MTTPNIEQLKREYKNALIDSLLKKTADPREHYKRLGLDEASIKEVQNEVGSKSLGLG